MRTEAGSTALAISGRTRMVRLLRRNARVSPTMKAGGSSLAPARMMVTVRGRGSGGGSRLTLAVATRLAMRHGQRAPDRRALGGQLLELGPAQPQHQAVAQCRDGGGARAAGQEGDLADRLARAELGHRLAPAFDGDRKAAGDDDIEGIRRLALAHQHVAAPEVQRLQLGGKARALLLLEIRKDLDPVEAMLGNLRLHCRSGVARRSLRHPIATASPGECAPPRGCICSFGVEVGEQHFLPPRRAPEALRIQGAAEQRSAAVPAVKSVREKRVPSTPLPAPVHPGIVARIAYSFRVRPVYRRILLISPHILP